MKVGFIGLGNMGLPMALNLLKAGHEVIGFDLVQSQLEAFSTAGGAIAANANAASKDADIVITMLPASRHVEGLYLGSDGLLAHANPKTLLVDCSTISPKAAQTVAAAAKDKGLAMIDAPVSGGTIGAEKGTLAIMVGGDKKIFNTVKPLFKSMGTAIYVGKTGCGQVAKLANQTIVGISIGAVSEALILAEAAGADPKAVREIMLHGFAGGPILKNHGLRILTKNFKPGGKASTQLKDMNNIIATAKKYKLNLPIAKKVQELYAKTVKSGRANLDHSALYLFIKALSR